MSNEICQIFVDKNEGRQEPTTTNSKPSANQPIRHQSTINNPTHPPAHPLHSFIPSIHPSIQSFNPPPPSDTKQTHNKLAPRTGTSSLTTTSAHCSTCTELIPKHPSQHWPAVSRPIGIAASVCATGSAALVSTKVRPHTTWLPRFARAGRHIYERSYECVATQCNRTF
jgi:hypothetical protein